MSFNIDREKEQDVWNLMGAMYVAVLFLGGANASVVQGIVATERTAFYRERAAGMYSALPYAFAQVLDFVNICNLKCDLSVMFPFDAICSISHRYIDLNNKITMQVAIETIYVAIQAGVYTFLLYSMIGFEWTAAKFFLFYYFLFMCFVYFTLYGMMAVALTPSLQIAAIIMYFFLNFWDLFSGFIIPRPVLSVTINTS